MPSISTREIKNRIRSMESTRQITKAMEMVAASKLRPAQARVANSRPYFEILYMAARDIARGAEGFSSPYLQGRETRRKLYIVIAGDRGLAGGYNSNILKLVQSQMTMEDCVLPIGKKAVDYFKAKNLSMFSEAYPQTAETGIGDCFSIARQVCKAYEEGIFDEVILCYTQFVSALSQVPGCRPILPLSRLAQEASGDSGRGCDTVYEGSMEEVFEKIVPEYLGGVLYGALCESTASEQAARRCAMDAATQNAEEMIAALRLTFNRARQAAITQEITEIVAGS